MMPCVLLASRLVSLSKISVSIHSVVVTYVQTIDRSAEVTAVFPAPQKSSQDMLRAQKISVE